MGANRTLEPASAGSMLLSVLFRAFNRQRIFLTRQAGTLEERTLLVRHGSACR
jgi:hypothetical protein